MSIQEYRAVSSAIREARRRSYAKTKMAAVYGKATQTTEEEGDNA